MLQNLMLRLAMVVVLLGLLMVAGGRSYGAQGGVAGAASGQPQRPNIVVILNDDMGYGDVWAYTHHGQVLTPTIDQLAKQGMRFTDMHSSSSLCTPSRYGILTGRYDFRSRLQHGVLGWKSKPLIKHGRMTVGWMLQRAGYVTGAVGKWHLGWDWTMKPKSEWAHHLPGFERHKDRANLEHVDYRGPVKRGPTTLGFDMFYGITASLDIPPAVYVHNGHVVEPPTHWVQRTKYAKRGGGGFHRATPIAPDFKYSDVLPHLTHVATRWIAAQAKDSHQPFFLYFALTGPHAPHAPDAKWKGKSKYGAYGDMVMECDDSVRQVLKTLQKYHVANNTIVIVTSDNGPSRVAVNLKKLTKKGHDPRGGLRGSKCDIWEGGHRVPFIVRWPGHVKAGTVSSQTLCLTDLMSTFASIVHQKLPPTVGVDSVNFLPVLEGKAKGPVQPVIVNHSGHGNFALRQGPWKLELCPGSGGWTPVAHKSKLPGIQLYNLSDDLREQRTFNYPQVSR